MVDALLTSRVFVCGKFHTKDDNFENFKNYFFHSYTDVFLCVCGGWGGVGWVGVFLYT